MSIPSTLSQPDSEPLALSVRGLNKTYEGGFEALKNVSIDIERGEIIALLGPNGAGKTTLISAICGIIRPTSGSATVEGYDIQADFRKTRALIGLVPQEITTDAFESVFSTVSFSRGLFGLAPDHQKVEKVLRSLSLWDKKDNNIITLSGGMKRRVMIAKALAHEPRVLFLDEPSAGVDVELRKDMWNVVRRLKESGVTIILTTHYIEEAEEIAERVAVINNGEIILVEEKDKLMSKLGKKQLILDLVSPLESIPASLGDFALDTSEDRCKLTYTFDSSSELNNITNLLDKLREEEIAFRDLNTTQSSLEEIFVDLVSESTKDAGL